MKRFQEQFHKNAEQIRLSAREKRELRERLSAYMAYHPLPEGVSLPAVSRPASPFMALIRSAAARRTLGALALVVLVAVPVYAERALPGDVLYPIKVRVNEGVRSQLANSPYEQVEWETTRLERRLAEARMLADAGKLTPEVEADVANAVRAHNDAAQEGIATMRESDRDEAAIAELTLSSALDVQSELFAGRSEAIAGVVDAARDSAAASSEGERPSYEKLLARVERESTTAYELLNSVRPNATETERTEVTKRLSSISTDVKDAIALYEAGEEGEAVDALAAALTRIRKVISFITDIDVRTNVSIETLLPENDSEELDRARIESSIKAARETLATLKVGTTTASSTLQEVDALLSTADDALVRGDLQEANTAVEEVRSLLQRSATTNEPTTIKNATNTPATSTENGTERTTSRATTSAESEGEKAKDSEGDASNESSSLGA